MRKTEKLYYRSPYQVSALARVVQIDGSMLELDRTLAYPEGGGQEADMGWIGHCASGTVIRFVDVKRRNGVDIKIGEGKYVNVDGVICHQVADEDLPLIDAFSVGDEVHVRIDPQRRERLSTSHSACHLIYLAAMEVRPNIDNQLIGCHIREGQARFDFLTEERFDAEEIDRIAEIANRWIEEDQPITTYESDSHADARYWECAGQVIPCGGTHIDRTGKIGSLSVKRKSIGKGKERLICVLPDREYSIGHYR